jgi:thioredoxin 1
MSAVPYTTFDKFTQDVLDSDVPVLVQFTASWCGPCKAMQPALEQVQGVLLDSHTGKVLKVDIEEEFDLAEEFGVKTVPTFMLFWDGESVDRSIGAVGVQGLVDLFIRNSNHAEASD